MAAMCEIHASLFELFGSSTLIESNAVNLKIPRDGENKTNIIAVVATRKGELFATHKPTRI